MSRVPSCPGGKTVRGVSARAIDEQHFSGESVPEQSTDRISSWESRKMKSNRNATRQTPAARVLTLILKLGGACLRQFPTQTYQK